MKFVIDELWITADAAFLKEKRNLADKLRIAIYTNLLLAKQFLYTEKFFILYIFFYYNVPEICFRSVAC